ncbi:MFS transporter [Sinomicrobium pectinilyticum]|uniref:MFS transporter n=2 Tax=Sinomicrobium pectinilyticum TaxID=1084421 RepID=A0A3N0EUB9_SINP1|nr:MFS transporter [Sinomicrobium pectinilyticum]
MAITTGMVVANNYYNQPLLADMAGEFEISEAAISDVPMLTQIGYAMGLFLIVPLGDMLKRKKMILIDFAFIIAALISAGMAPGPATLKVSSLFIGLTSVIPQLMIPMAAQLAEDRNRGKAIGTVMTGMFIGILGSRTLSGFIGSYLGWRSMFFIAAGIIAVLWFFLKWKLPEIRPDFKGTYKQLLISIVEQFKTKPKLRLAALRGSLVFASFSVFWTTLIFLLETPVFNMGSREAGAFGFVGIAGAVIATVVGKLSDTMNKNTIIMVSVFIAMLSWVLLGLGAGSIVVLIIGALFLDLGIQAVHITNQTIIFEDNPPERNRINTVYMVLYFTGGATGTFIGGIVWQYFGWTGVSAAGFGFGVLTLLVHLAWKK